MRAPFLACKNVASPHILTPISQYLIEKTHNNKTYHNPEIFTSLFINHSKDTKIREEIQCWLETPALLQGYMYEGLLE
jgi:hypothetical protein